MRNVKLNTSVIHMPTRGATIGLRVRLLVLKTRNTPFWWHNLKCFFAILLMQKKRQISNIAAWKHILSTFPYYFGGGGWWVLLFWGLQYCTSLHTTTNNIQVLVSIKHIRWFVNKSAQCHTLWEYLIYSKIHHLSVSQTQINPFNGISTHKSK